MRRNGTRDVLGKCAVPEQVRPLESILLHVEKIDGDALRAQGGPDRAREVAQ